GVTGRPWSTGPGLTFSGVRVAVSFGRAWKGCPYFEEMTDQRWNACLVVAEIQVKRVIRALFDFIFEPRSTDRRVAPRDRRFHRALEFLGLPRAGDHGDGRAAGPHDGAVAGLVGRQFKRAIRL